MLHDKIDESIPSCSSPVKNEYCESDDEPSDYMSTSVDDASEGCSHLKKIAVF